MFSLFWDTHHFHLLSLPELNHVATSISEGSWEIESFSRCPCAWLKIGCVITKKEGRMDIAASAIVLKGFKEGNTSNIAKTFYKIRHWFLCPES